MHAQHVVHKRTLSRTLKVGIKKTNPLVKSLSRLLRKSLGSFVQVSTVHKNHKKYSFRDGGCRLKYFAVFEP